MDAAHLSKLISSVTGCQTLLRRTIEKTTSDNDCADNDNNDASLKCCWLTEPRSALARAKTLTIMTNLQLEAPSAIESFCRLCDLTCDRSDRPAPSNLINFTGTKFKHYQPYLSPCELPSTECDNCRNKMAAIRNSLKQGDKMPVSCKTSEKGPCRQNSHSLGIYKSAIISQLREIHLLLLSLVEDMSSELAGQHRRGRAQSADLRMDNCRCSNSVCKQESRASAETPIMTRKHVQRPNAKVPTHIPIKEPPTSPHRQSKAKRKISRMEQQQHKKTQWMSTKTDLQTKPNERSVSGWSYACAQSVEKQLCFATTQCVGPRSVAAKAKQVAAYTQSLRSGDTEPEGSGSDEYYVSLLSRTYTFDSSPSCGDSSASNFCEVVVKEMDAPSASTSNSSSILSAGPISNVGESIIFQRVFDPVKRLMPEQTQRLMATLYRLKYRIDAIKQRLADSCEQANLMNSNCSKRSIGHRGSTTRRPRKRSGTKMVASRNQSKMASRPVWQESNREIELTRIKASLDATIRQLSQFTVAKS